MVSTPSACELEMSLILFWSATPQTYCSLSARRMSSESCAESAPSSMSTSMPGLRGPIRGSSSDSLGGNMIDGAPKSSTPDSTMAPTSISTEPVSVVSWIVEPTVAPTDSDTQS